VLVGERSEEPMHIRAEQTAASAEGNMEASSNFPPSDPKHSCSRSVFRASIASEIRMGHLGHSGGSHQR